LFALVDVATRAVEAACPGTLVVNLQRRLAAIKM
jgi:hypothetical protein